jgi:serine/threonine-protein kinase
MAQPTWIGYKLNNRYQIIELLGQGGMSSVYRAWDPKLRRNVAVKIIHPHLSENPRFVRRFGAEAAAVARLRHPNIRQVFDFDHDGETFYMILEFLPGETLKERLAGLRQMGQLMPLAETISITQQICSAVAYAHKNGVIHRDIKPANVVISPQGEAVLTDFGIAKMVGTEQFTATGSMVGTAAYISPEQVEGKPVDHRADIYAIGVMLFEMVSGYPPFEADSMMALMQKHVHEAVPNLRERKPDLNLKLIAIIEKALAKNPNKRYQKADQIAAALDALPVPEEFAHIEPRLDDTLTEGALSDKTIPEEIPPIESAVSETYQLPMPDIDTELPADTQTNGGIPRRIIELVSAAIGGGTVVVLGLICLITVAILILSRIFPPDQRILNPTFFVQAPENTPIPPPQDSFIDLENQPASFADYLGEWVLVNNWTLDCQECLSSASALDIYFQNHEDENFTVIGVNAGDESVEVEAYLAQNPVSYPIWLDPERVLVEEFGDVDLPSYLLLTPEGAVHSTFQGALDQEMLEEYITPMLK